MHQNKEGEWWKFINDAKRKEISINWSQSWVRRMSVRKKIFTAAEVIFDAILNCWGCEYLMRLDFVIFHCNFLLEFDVFQLKYKIAKYFFITSCTLFNIFKYLPHLSTLYCKLTMSSIHKPTDVSTLRRSVWKIITKLFMVDFLHTFSRIKALVVVHKSSDCTKKKLL